jgi:hypothetical protein
MEMSDLRFPRSYTTFRVIIGTVVLVIGVAAGWALLAWGMPYVGIDVSTLVS